jgi:nucleoside-diphosphate-sugar epimerase
LDLSDATVLVTGASGFIGAHLCDRLRRRGAKVHALSRRDHADEGAGIRWWRGDLSDFDAVSRLFGSIRPDFVFHLASEVTGSREPGQVLPTFHNNLVSSVHVLLAGTESRCRRIVITGSLEEPDAHDPAPIPCSPYAAAKWAASGYARMFHALYGTPVVLARLFMVYGPGQADLRKLVPFVILKLLQGEAPPMSSGLRPVDWIYVDDVVNGLLAAATAREVEGQTVELGSGELVTTRQVAGMIADLIGSGIEPRFGALPDRPLEQVRVADRGTRERMDWRPEVPLLQGLERTIEHYRAGRAAGRYRV